MDDLDTKSGRLRYLAKKRGYVNAVELARELGKPYVTVQQHLSGIRGYGEGAAKLYGRKLRFPWMWLLHGGPLNQEAEITPIKGEVPIAPHLVPLLRLSESEQFRTILSGGVPMSDESVPAPKNLKINERVFACYMNDNSMEGVGKENINESDEIFIDPKAEYKSGDIVVAIVPGFEGAMVRKYRRTSRDTEGNALFDLVPVNPDADKIENAHERKTQIVGRVVYVGRAF